LQVVQAHGGTVTAVAFTPDGKRLVSFGRTQAQQDMSYGKDLPHEIKLWEVATGRQLPLGIKGATDKARWAALSPDGTRLAAPCEDQGIRVWDLATGEPSTLELQAKELDVYVGFSADGKRLVSMSIPYGDSLDKIDNYTVRVWDLASHKVIARVEKLAYARNPPEFSPDGTLLAFVSACA
jgi:WD40 repeat protein